MKGLHDEIGPWDFSTTYRIISERFWWSAIQIKVARFVRSFDMCQKTNPPEQGLPYGKMPVSGLFHTWYMDFAVPLPRTRLGRRYLIIAVEHLTGWPVAHTLPESLDNSMGVIQFLEKESITTYRYPVSIMSDYETEFHSAPISDYAK